MSNAHIVREFLDAITSSVPADPQKKRYLIVAVGRNPYINDKGKYRHHDWDERPFEWPAQADEAVAEIEHWAPLGDVYACPYLMNTKERKKGNAAWRQIIHSDVDGDGDELLKKVRKLGGYVAWSGSPGHGHVYAALEYVVTQEQHEVLCEGLRDYLGADAKIRDNDLLRLPGTYSHKLTLHGGRSGGLAGIVMGEFGSSLTPTKMDDLCEILGVDIANLDDREDQSHTNGGKPSATVDAGAREDVDLTVYPSVRDVLDKVRDYPTNRSDDSYEVVCVCQENGLKLEQARWVVDQDPALAGRVAEFLARRPPVDDVAISYERATSRNWMAGVAQQAPPPFGSIDGAALLEDLRAWFGRFIVVVAEGDLRLLALWVVHTYLCPELYTTPRLLIDSIAPGSGKSTLLEHLAHLCLRSMPPAISVSSSALIPRILEKELRTVLLDEIQRTLVEGRPGVDEVIAVINSGYRSGATRPVLVPKGRDWVLKDLPTFAPLAMAGNSPNLPQDAVDRSIRILLMPDIDGLAEDSDWEELDAEVKTLQQRVSDWVESVRAHVKGAKGKLPAKCVGRLREKWRPLMRIAELADETSGGQTWKDTVHTMAEADIEDMEAEREDGLRKQVPAVVLLRDLYLVWPLCESFMPTVELLDLLIGHNPDYWDEGTTYSGAPRKALNATRFGRMARQATGAISKTTGVTSIRPGRGGTPRGYTRRQFEKAWRTLKIDTP